MKWRVRKNIGLYRKVICKEEEIEYKGDLVSGDFLDIFPRGHRTERSGALHM
jgi:hypothetical protein